MNAKNNLEAFALKDINELETVGSTDKVNVLVEAGRMEGYDASNGDWRGTRRYLVKKDGDTAVIGSTLLEDIGKTDMGDPGNIAAFGRWGKSRYPAKRYLFIVWNHGTGWVKTRGISYDDETGNHVNIPQLARALRDIGGVDLYASDACLMQMAEVAYEIRDQAAYIVGSEETEPTDGHDYAAILSELAADPEMGPERLGEILVDSYAAQYERVGRGSTHSLVRASALGGLAAAMREFTAAAMRSGDKDVLLKARGSAQAYSRRENKDLYDLARRTAEASSNSELRAAARSLMEKLKGEVIVLSRFTNSDGGSWWLPTHYDDSSGLAVYLPARAADNGYEELRWAADSGWLEFLSWLASP
ncbi:MAG: clostripain-related cysteine peptidase [Elusimicrobiales bacterium]|nr:clostripain-related cysteine peptidase [Elusimicrobiales bacterium]